MADETPDTTKDAVGPGAGSAMPETPQAIMQRGLDQREEAPQEEADPWAALGEDARSIAEKKGWRSPADMLKAYQAATAKLSERDEEKEGLMAELARYEASQRQPEAPAPQQTQAQVGGQAIDFDALAAACVDPQTGDMNYGQMMSLASALGARMAFDAAEARMAERFAQFETERVQPLTQRAEQERIEAELEDISGFYGDERYEALEKRIEDRLKDEPGYLDRFGGSLRGAFADMNFELQREEREAEAAAANAHTTRSSGRRPQERPLTPAEQELAMMSQMRSRINDGF